MEWEYNTTNRKEMFSHLLSCYLLQDMKFIVVLYEDSSHLTYDAMHI